MTRNSEQFITMFSFPAKLNLCHLCKERVLSLCNYPHVGLNSSITHICWSKLGKTGKENIDFIMQIASNEFYMKHVFFNFYNLLGMLILSLHIDYAQQMLLINLSELNWNSLWKITKLVYRCRIKYFTNYLIT
jgi:hypothetical protein